MDLPISDNELATIVKAMSLGGDTALYQKLKLVKELREQDLPYAPEASHNLHLWQCLTCSWQLS